MKVKIAGKKISVRYVPLTECVGMYCHNEEEILIDEEKEGTQMAVDTLLHELAHAGLGVTGLGAALGDALEEAVVTWCEQVYLPAARKVLTQAAKG